ncbi:zinc phosphodiesterase-like protein, partial [Leptotrombidium deliense]
MTRFFGVDAQLGINQYDYNEGPFKDSVMEVHKINLHKNINSPLKKPRTTSEHDVCSYVCNFHDKPGELMIKKCIELKVPRGPLLGKLKEGEDVTLDDGRTILSKDVVGEPEKGPILFIIDCPTEDYVETLFASDVIADFQTKCTNT